jgi:ketosteroid isomerase-like protein
MSKENVEIVRRAYTALSRGDSDVIAELSSPDFVTDFSRRLVDPFVLRGRDETIAFIMDQSSTEAWDGWPAWEPQELIDAGDQVVAFIRFSAKGKASGAEVEAYVANLWTFGSDGRLIEMKYFGDERAAALEAAGLGE